MFDLSASHLGFSDESRYNHGRYRSVGLVTLTVDVFPWIQSEIQKIAKSENLREIKYSELSDGRQFRSALKLVEFVLKVASEGKVRVDVLSWDTQDKRHSVAGRDDIANLARMLHHLYVMVLKQRWPDSKSWAIYPDSNNVVDWQVFEQFLTLKGVLLEERIPLFQSNTFEELFREVYAITEVKTVSSHDAPLCWVADLFAGLAVKSKEDFDLYKKWWVANPKEAVLDLPGLFESPKVSKGDLNRFLVIRKLRGDSHKQRLGVSLKNSGCLNTPDPKKPINFWWWQSQHDKDRAPVMIKLKDKR